MNESVKDKKIKIVGLTNYLIELPSWKRSVLITLVVSVIVGMIGYILLKQSFDIFNILKYGTIMGLVFLGLPAVFAGVFGTLATKISRKELQYRRSFYMSFFGMLIISIIFLIGILVSFGNLKLLFDILIFGYVLVFAVRTFILMVTYPYNIFQSITIAAIHPLFGYIFIFLSSLLASTSGLLPLPMIGYAALFTKAAVSSLILLIGIILFVVLVNAPMRRNFGISAFSLTGAFLAHWLDGSSAIEEKLKPLSEKADALIAIMAFKAKTGLKSLFIIPYLHPGPFGEVGGAKMSRIFTETIEPELNASVFIPHGIATHDLNPISSDSIYQISEEIIDSTKEIKFSGKASNVINTKTGNAKVMGQKFGDTAFLISTFSPEPTEDIDFSIGLAVMNKLEKNFKNVIYADAHNCHKPGHHTIFSGDPVVFDLMDAMESMSGKLTKQRTGRIKLGTSVDLMAEYDLEHGIGPAGLRVCVFEINKKRNAYVIFDGNNMVAGLREKIIKEVKKLGISEVEVMTTDTHCVNNIRGVENPVGMKIKHPELIKLVVENTKKAIDDLETVSAGTKIIKIKDIDVFGAQKSTELVSTVNSMIAIMKIMSPIIFGVTLTLSLLGVLFVPW